VKSQSKSKHPNCPVCGYDDMPYPPRPFNVCPCCGTEFGVDDRRQDHPALRKAWIANGLIWFSDIRYPGKNWSGSAQLIKANLAADLLTNNNSVSQTSRDTVSIVDKAFWSAHDLDLLKVA
jgi:hypothetical protein